MSQNNEPFPNPMNALVDLNDNTVWMSGMDQSNVPSILKPLKIKNRHWDKYSNEFNNADFSEDDLNLSSIDNDVSRSLSSVEGFKEHEDKLRQVLVTFEAIHGENTDDNIAYLQNFGIVAALCVYYTNYNTIHAYVLYCFIMKSKLLNWAITLQMEGQNAYRRSLVICFFLFFITNYYFKISGYGIL